MIGLTTLYLSMLICTSRESVCVVSVGTRHLLQQIGFTYYIIQGPTQTLYIDWKWLMIHIYQLITKHMKIILKKKIFYFLYLALSYSVYLHIPDKSLVGGKVPITSTQLAQLKILLLLDILFQLIKNIAEYKVYVNPARWNAGLKYILQLLL